MYSDILSRCWISIPAIQTIKLSSLVVIVVDCLQAAYYWYHPVRSLTHFEMSLIELLTVYVNLQGTNFSVIQLHVCETWLLGAPELVTGSRDGLVKVWDPRQKDEPVATMEPSEGETKRDCWAVAFGHAFNVQDRCVAAGYDNGDIKLFDLRKMAVRWETNLKNGVSWVSLVVCAVWFTWI